MRRTTELVLMIEVGVIIILLILLTFHFFGKDEVRTEKKVETEQVPEDSEKEASKDLEEDLEGLVDESEDKGKREQIKGEYVFDYEGKPDLSFVKADFGVYLTPVTKGSNTYVPIKFFTKSYIKKLSTQVPGLEPNSIPMTDKENPANRPPGKAWSLDESKTAYYFVDFGQKVKKTNDNSTVQIPLNAYAGQKPGGYEIWLMYEAAVLNKQGFNQNWNNGDFVSNGDGGFNYAGNFSGFSYLDK